MKEATAKRREKPRAEKEKSGAEPQDVEMKEEDQRAPREQDQLTLDGLDNTHTHTHTHTHTPVLSHVTLSVTTRADAAVKPLLSVINVTGPLLS